MNLVEQTLDRRAADYVGDTLAAGNSLARRIGRLDAFRKSVFTTSLPKGATGIYDFAVGGKLPQPPQSDWIPVRDGVAIPTPSLRAKLAEEIHAYLSQAPRGLCIIEESFAKPGSPVLNAKKTRIIVFADEVYYAITPSANIEAIQVAIRESFAIPTYSGVFTSFSGGVLTGALDEITISSLAQEAKGGFVGAYDGEGFIMWHVNISGALAGDPSIP